MSYHDALEAARKLFGSTAVVQEHATWTRHGELRTYFVGKEGSDAYSWSCHGVGASWEDALRDAAVKPWGRR